MTSTRYLALAAIALCLPACSTFKKKDPNYDTADGGGYDTSNPYGTPDAGGGEGAPYQPVNPPAAASANPTYSPAAYEENTAQAAPAAAAAHAAPAASPAASHVVAKGDTLGGIARQYGTTAAAIKQANGMTSDTVVLGKTLAIPAGSAPASRPAAGNASAGGKTHTVVKGDSLAKISRQHGVTVEALKKANSMTNDTVVLGTKLRIP